MGAYSVYRPVAVNGALGPRGIMPPIHRAPNIVPPISRDSSPNLISEFVLQPTGLSVGGSSLFIFEEKSIVPQIAIESMNEKLEPIIARIETLTAEGKIKSENSAWILGLIDQHRSQATKAMNEEDIPGFIENLANLEQIMGNMEALRDLYSNQLQLGVARATLDEAYKAGLFSQDTYEAAKEQLSSKVAENARSKIENNETRFAVTSMELMQMMESLSKIRTALDVYKSQSRSNDLRGMNHTAKRDIIPKMDSINMIDQDHLTENGPLINNAAKVLQTLRTAQAELLEHTRKQLEKSGGYEYATEAVDVIVGTIAQAARTDANEATILPDTWEAIWKAAHEQDAKSKYNRTKDILHEEELLMLSLLETIVNSGGPKTISQAKSTAFIDSCKTAIVGTDASMINAHMASIEDGANHKFLILIFQILEEMLDRVKAAREAQAKKQFEEDLFEKKLEKRRQSKKTEAKIRLKEQIFACIIALRIELAHQIAIIIQENEAYLTTGSLKSRNEDRRTSRLAA